MTIAMEIFMDSFIKTPVGIEEEKAFYHNT